MTSPALSVCLPADRAETIHDVVACLAAQDEHEQIELVVVTDGDAGAIEAALPRNVFAGIRVVTVPDLSSLGAARGAAVRAAGAQILVLGETHSYPEAGWAAALIERHQEPWAVVGPSMECASSGSGLAWAGLLMDYGPWVERRTSLAMDDVPAHNGCYKRHVLLAFGEALEEALAADQVLNELIRTAGGPMFLESRARTRHLNVGRLGPFLSERFHSGRMFAVARSAQWSRPRRLAYALAWPLIPAVRAVRIGGHLRRMRRLGSLGPRIALPFLLGLPASALGEGVGYVLGTGGAPQAVYEFELHRTAYASPPLLPTA